IFGGPYYPDPADGGYQLGAELSGQAWARGAWINNDAYRYSTEITDIVPVQAPVVPDWVYQ
ncbi:MAG: hypothetical protein FWF29_01420, partial [Treponema sp.]|nr:hypothetical protein [Treponema sp.]